MPSSLTLTPQISESDLHGLEKSSELLGAPPGLVMETGADSEWLQADRAVGGGGLAFPVARH